MKKTDKHATRLVIWSVAACIMANSCAEGIQDIVMDINQEQLAGIGRSAISIKVDEKKLKSAEEISLLVERIIQDRDFAKEFRDNPHTYLIAQSQITRTGTYENVIVVDDEIERLVSALADDDIAEAIDNKDIKSTIILMYQKGYLDVTAYEHYADQLSSEQKQQILNSLGLSEINEDFVVPAVAFPVAVFVLFAYQTAIVAVHAVMATVQAAAYATFFVKAEVKVSGGLSINDEESFCLYLLKSPDEEVETSEEFGAYITDIVDAFQFIKRDIIKKRLGNDYYNEMSSLSKNAIVKTAALNLNND